MKIQILAFGIARDILGSSFTDLDIEANKSLGTLRTELLAKYPNFEKLAALAFAVNEEYQGEDFILSNGDEVAIIPPVSGG